MKPTDHTSAKDSAPILEERAAEQFLRAELDDWSASGPVAQNGAEPVNKAAFAQAQLNVERAWHATGIYATSPELMALREQALARVRKANARRWLQGPQGMSKRWAVAAAVGGIAIASAFAFYWTDYGFTPDSYRTQIGEQRVVELEDHSRVALDAQTRIRVDYDSGTRIVQLLQGQAQFSVAKDPRRPFKVIVGDRTIIALGTTFTVEYFDKQIRVALLEGKVAVLPPTPTVTTTSTPDTREVRKTIRTDEIVELAPGEEWRMRRNGNATVDPRADLEAAVAWRQGKLIFHHEPLGEAVRRLNRYSTLQLEIVDPSLQSMNVSGVFEAGDTNAFAEAMQAYLPVEADYSQAGLVRLNPRKRLSK